MRAEALCAAAAACRARRARSLRADQHDQHSPGRWAGRASRPRRRCRSAARSPAPAPRPRPAPAGPPGGWAARPLRSPPRFAKAGQLGGQQSSRLSDR
jgi:hypothetical protein